MGGRVREETTLPQRWGQFPEPPENSPTLHGDESPHWSGKGLGEKVLAVRETRQWQEIIVPRLRALDLRRDPRGRQREWSAEEKEIVLLAGRMKGKLTVVEARKELLADFAAREVLGFNRRRVGRLGEPVGIDAFLPSVRTLRAYLRKFGEEERLAVYEELDAALVNEYFSLPEVQSEPLYAMDGHAYRTHYTAPKITPAKSGKPRRVTNAKHITAPDAGYVPGDGPKAGKGWTTIIISNNRGVMAARKTAPLNAGEKTEAKIAIERFSRRVAPLLPADQFGVLTADGAFSGHDIREQLRDLGVLENIHPVSHGQSSHSKKRAREFDQKRVPLVDPTRPAYKNWFVNGHRELVCSCGKGRIERDVKKRGGKVSAAIIGRCKTCGNVRVQSGRWRRANNPDRYVLCQPEEYDRADLLLGNPLTYNCGMAQAYGKLRFGLQEGLFGSVRNNGVPKITWFRRQRQVELDLAMVNCVNASLSLVAHKASRAGPAPPLRAAA